MPADPDLSHLPEELARFLDSYRQLFGTVPPLPAAKFAFASEAAPEALTLVERLRAHAFHTDVLDEKVVQLLIFGLLVSHGSGAARWHAVAARRAGATWRELAAVVELSTAVAALEPANSGYALLQDLQDHDR